MRATSPLGPRVAGLGPLGLLLLLFAAASAPVRASPATEASFPFAAVRDACVEILVGDHLWGSGWIATEDGFVVTAAHCVRARGRVEVLWQTKRLLARRVAVDLGSDLALLRLPPRGTPYPSLPLASSPPPPTAPIWLVGSPIYRHGVLLSGAAGAGEATHEWYANLGRYVRVHHVSAMTPPGVSGAPWLDRNGNVVALHSGTMTRKDVPVGVGFVVPSARIAAFLEGGEDVTTPTLGSSFEEVWEQAEDTLARYPPRTEGVVVLEPRPGGPLARAGVARWHVITAIDGRPVRYRDDLLSYVRARAVGETVALSLLLPDRKGRRVVRVTLAAIPPP